MFSRLRKEHLGSWCRRLVRSAVSFDRFDAQGAIVVVRRIVLALLVAGLFVCAPCAWGQISLVQATTCASPGTSCTIPATGSGHLIVVGWTAAWGTTPTISTITDNASNAYVEATGARAVDASVGMVDIWYAANSASGATNVTITPNPSGGTGVAVIWEFSGVAAVSPLDQVGVLNSQPAPTQYPTLGASVTTTAPVEAVVSVTAPQWFIAPLAGGSFTQDFLIVTPSGPPYYYAGWAHLITSTTGTYSANWGSWGNIYTSTAASFMAGAAYSACDLNQDGTVNILDVQVGTDMALGNSPCTAVYGPCNVALVQAVLANAMGEACALPELGAAPSSISFGNVAVGSSSTQTLTLTGGGTSATTISQPTVSGAGFSISGPVPASLTVGQTATFNVTFTPAAAGPVSGSVVLSSNALNTPANISLSGTGAVSAVPVLSAVPAGISFGNVLVGSSTTQAVTLSGSGTVTISQATVSGAGFSITGPSLPLTLSVGQTATFNVTFAPAAGGGVSGNVAFVSNASDMPLNLPLSGTGLHYLTLSWTPSTTSSVTSYSIYRAGPSSSNSGTPATPYPLQGSVLANTCTPTGNPTQCAYTDSTVVAGQWYWYYVTAVAGTNASTPSNIPPGAQIPSP